MKYKGTMWLLTSVLLPYCVFGHLSYIENDAEEKRAQIIVDLIGANLVNSKWTNIMCAGDLQDLFYHELKRLPFTSVVTHADHEELSIKDVTPYYSNTIILSFQNLKDFEHNMAKITQSPYWHPHSIFFLYCHSKPDSLLIAKFFFVFWYYQSCNVVFIQYDDKAEKIYVSNYSPYNNNKFGMDKKIGCWTNRKTSVAVTTLEESFKCVENCHNVSLRSDLRANNLGTCIRLNETKISYNDREIARSLYLFEENGKNLYGFALRAAYTTETLPFLRIEKRKNQTYTLHGREGFIWNSMSELMNFSMDLSPSANIINNSFNFEINIHSIFALAYRKVDLYLVPLYQFDTSKTLKLDYTIPFEQSGVCVLSHRADFEIIIFDAYFLFKSYKFVIESTICNLLIWVLFSLFRFVDTRRLTFDEIGKDMMNTIRSILLISLHNPPKKTSFRLFMLITMWSFFLISFATQAAIISFFTAVKRGKDIDTFEDIVAKGYAIEGMLSPDILLLEDDERLRQIHSKLKPTQDYFECVKRMSNDSRRFCLVDCSISRYMQKNILNDKGEQYLHISEDTIHNYYLALILPKHSPMTPHINKYLRRFIEAGLLTKWNEYKYDAIKDETPLKPLGLENFKSIFKGYCILISITVSTFLIEVTIGKIEKVMSAGFSRNRLSLI